MKTYVASEGDTVDYIAWKAYGRQDAGIVEQVLAANIGLADIGAALPAGTVVQLPVIDAAKVNTGTRLWD